MHIYSFFCIYNYNTPAGWKSPQTSPSDIDNFDIYSYTNGKPNWVAEASIQFPRITNKFYSMIAIAQ